jgi:TolA-binding protein
MFALILGGGPVRGGGPVPAASHEDRAYAAACAAFQDKFYVRAESGFTAFLQNYRKSTNAPAAMLMLAQAQFYQAKYTDAVARLTDTNNVAMARAAGIADRYLYWTAEARYAGGDTNGAAETFVSVSERFPKSTLAVKAVVEGAAAYGKLGQWARVDELLEDTNGVFQRVEGLTPTNPAVADGRLLAGESKLVQRDFGAAIGELNQMDRAKLTPEQDWKRAFLLCRANWERNDLEAALSAATNLLEIARQGRGADRPANLAQSVVYHASLLEREGRPAEAEAAWRENLAAGTPVEQQELAILKIVELATAQNNLPDAETNLTGFLTQFPDAPAAELARLTLGELHVKDFMAQPAATNYLLLAQNNFLTVSTDGPFAGKAYLDRGWCDWLWAGRAAEGGDTNGAAQWTSNSLTDFAAAVERMPRSEDLAVARFKLGDAQFALGQFAESTNNYGAVLTDFAEMPKVADSLSDRALYQILRAELELHDTNGMDETMDQLMGKFFTNVPATNSLLLAGRGFSDFGSPAKARALFLRFERERTNSPLLPQVAYAVARTYEREQNWAAAVTNYGAWLQEYSTNGLRAEVEYARDLAMYQTGDEDGAFQMFTNFVAEYPTNTLKPRALWAVADHYFRGGTNFAAAERNYQLIFQEFPEDELAYPAQLMAARSVMARFTYPEAIRLYLTPLLGDTNCPENLRDQARFAYCESLLFMHATDTNNVNLQTATNVLAQMTPKAGTNIVGALAWCEMGDCDWQLGDFDAATSAYAQVLSSPPADRELRSRAQVGMGLVLEKKAEGLPAEAQRPLLAQALEHYTEVVYTTNDVADAFWMKKAAVQALPLMPLVKQGDVDLFVRSLEYWLPQLRDILDKKRAALGH